MESMGRLRWLVILLIGLVPAPIALAEQAAGDACYKYVDSESLTGARYAAVALAKRKALETFPPFQEATVNVRDPVLLREIITNLLVRGLDRVKVVRETEDPIKREVCRAIEAQADGEKIKSMVRAVEKSFRFRQGDQETGLPGNGNIQVVSAQESLCREGDQRRCLYVAVQCVRNTFGQRDVVRVTWFDTDGKPSFTAKERVLCEHPGDVSTFWLRMPPQGAVFSLDVPTG